MATGWGLCLWWVRPYTPTWKSWLEAYELQFNFKASKKLTEALNFLLHLISGQLNSTKVLVLFKISTMTSPTNDATC